MKIKKILKFKTFLGYPFTKGGCTETPDATNDYVLTEEADVSYKRAIVYKKTQCVMRVLIKTLMEYCGCYLPYITKQSLFQDLFNITFVDVHELHETHKPCS